MIIDIGNMLSKLVLTGFIVIVGWITVSSAQKAGTLGHLLTAVFLLGMGAIWWDLVARLDDEEEQEK